jgi:protein-S-isoprenylcysteine O-methyltransferase Ste14
MRASAAEFRHRFWVIALLFCAAFMAYRVDHRNLSVALVALGGLDPASQAGDAAVTALLLGGSAVIALGAAVRTWATAYFDAGIIHDHAVHTTSLVADGPYRHVRNPLYLGVMLMALGMALFASRLGAAVLILGMPVVLLRLIGREEEHLLAAQGDGYRVFQAAVPRLLPSLRPGLPASGRSPRWGQAWRGEAFMWIFAVAAAIFAVTRDGGLFGIASVVGMAAYVMVRRLIRPKGATATP